MTEEAIVAPADEAGVIVTADTPAEVSDNDELGAVFDKYERDSGSSRDERGRFASDRAKEAPQEVEGSAEPEDANAAPEAAEATQEAKPSVPLPPTLTGLDEAWSKIPPEAQEAIAASQQKLHKNMSDMGRALASYKPVNDVITEFKEYFGGERGTYKPDEAIRFLFGLQRSMDDDPVGTLLQIADTYELRPKLQSMFGGGRQGAEGQSSQQQDYTNELLAKIDGLERHIRQISDPSRVDERINARLSEEKARQAEEKVYSDLDEVITRTATKEAMPLYAEAEKYLPQIIPIAAQKLGGSAAPADLLKLAYDMAVNADPDLRKKAAALASAAQPDTKRVADARKANATNIRSTSTGSPREMTEDEALDAIWDKHKRA